jgi:hypothetical protein
MHETQYYFDIIELYFYTTQETKISKSYLNHKVKTLEVFTKIFLLRVRLKLFQVEISRRYKISRYY